jgi:hypothetical protein
VSNTGDIIKGFIQAKHMAGFEPHDWVFDYRDRYRDEDGREFIIEIYKCECGAGHRETIPIEAWSL